MKQLSLSLLLVLGAGCSVDKALTMDVGADAGDESFSQDSLRLDVFPSDATPGLEPQSVHLEGETEWTGLQVEIAPSVILSGQVLGFLATPHSGDPTVPGQDDQAITARVDVVLDDSVAGGSATTTEDGHFELLVPPGKGYRVDVVPEQTDRVPFDSTTIPVLASDLDLGVWYLDYGFPVWGQVTYSDDTAPRGATVHLVDAESGTPGPTTSVDSDGWYMLRAYSGSYNLVVEGRTGGSDPTLSRTITLTDADEDLRVDIDLGPSQRATLVGTLVDAQGYGLASDRSNEYRVRATSARLRDVAGTLTVERTTAAGGAFELSLPAGEWDIELIPPYDAGLSPVLMNLTMSDADLDIGELVLPSSIAIDVTVLDSTGAAAPDALVVAREVGFDGYTYSATTDDDGIASFDVPAVAIELTATPPTDASAITRAVIDPVDDPEPRIELSAGVPVSGALTSEDEAVAFALVEIRDSDGLLYGTAITDSAGAFSMRVPQDPSAVTP